LNSLPTPGGKANQQLLPARGALLSCFAPNGLLEVSLLTQTVLRSSP